MGLRLNLHQLLVDILGTQDEPADQSRVYFQPPANVKMLFPCFTYSRDSTEAVFADNNPYRLSKRYQVTYIDHNPDSDIPEKVSMLPMSTHNTTFVADNLNHYVFTLYF